jgi:hypothetical protein
MHHPYQGWGVLHASAVLLGGACAEAEVCLSGGCSPITRRVKPVYNFAQILCISVIQLLILTMITERNHHMN